MKKVDAFMCEGCGKVYTGFKAAINALRCEVTHKDNVPEKAKDVIGMGYDPCEVCANAFYVYGCEFDCKYLKECGSLEKGYEKFDLETEKF